MRIFPQTVWGRLRLTALFLVAIVVLPTRQLAEQARVTAVALSADRVRDHAGVMPDELEFERFLQQIYEESGVDVRLLFVSAVTGETLEAFSVRQARSLGVGRDSDRRGLLFVYDVAARRLRIEVGAQMESIITDAFAGYLMREHVRSFFGAGNPSLGLRTTLFMVQHRLRESVLGQSYDPRAVEFIEDVRRLAVGGGTSADMRADSASAFLNGARTSDRATRIHFAPQQTPELAYQRWLEWMAREGYQTDVPLFTPQSQEYMAGLPMTRAYKAYILMIEYGRPYRIDVRGDLALLYFTTTPLAGPHFFRRTAEGWVIDLLAEVLNTRNYAGFWYTWGLLDNGDEFATTFADRYQSNSGILRVRGGDNRPLPSLAYPEVTLTPAPDPADTVVHVTVEEAAARIGAAGPRVLVVFYHVWSQQAIAALPALSALATECHKAGVTLLAYSTDQEVEALDQLSALLRRAGAPFPATHLRQWPSGHLTATMAPLGIRVNRRWSAPIMAVRVAGAGVVAQTEGLGALADGAAEIRAACASGHAVQ